MQWHVTNKFPQKIWKSKYFPYYLLVQRRKGGKSHPTPRYYWKTSITNINQLTGYKKFDYEMSVQAAMNAAQGAVLEAKICDNIDTR